MPQRKSAFRRSPALWVPALLCVLCGPVSAGTLYKWIDEDGTVRYSDRLPPKQNQHGHQQLNSQGVVLSTREAAKSPEEMAIEAEAKRKQEAEDREAARIKAIQDAQDRVLLMTFASEEELEQVRDNRIQDINSVIRLIENSIETTREKLEKLEHNAQISWTSKGNDIPGGIQQKIEHFSRKVETRTEQLQTKVAERERIREKYELDLARFRNLKSASN